MKLHFEINSTIFTKTSFKKIRYGLTLILILILFIQDGYAQSGIQTFSTPGTFTGVNGFIPSPGVTSVTVEVWGGGGAGGGGNLVAAAGGGGGGYRKTTNVTVVPGTQYTIIVGAGGVGAATSGQVGGTSSGTFGATTVAATGGNGGRNANTPVGTGGTGSNTGGSGAPGVNFGHGGGGGSSAGPGTGAGINGNTATSGTGASSVTGGGAGGNGGGTNGLPGAAPGGGGGGGIGTGTVLGGSGGNGKVVITYTCPTATISYTSSGFCKSVTSAPVTINGSMGGTFSVVPASGLTIDGSGTINPSTSTAGTYTVHYQIAGGNGCSAVDATAAIKIDVPVASVSNQANISCFGGSDGTITISASAGTSPYTFSINNGTNYFSATGTDLRQFTGLVANTPYTIKVKDANGCISN